MNKIGYILIPKKLTLHYENNINTPPKSTLNLPTYAIVKYPIYSFLSVILAFREVKHT
jgi:hypothetical protein